MIYADGAGAAILEANDHGGAILTHASESHTLEDAHHLFFGPSYNPALDDTRYIKMYGRKIYEFAVSHVPQAMKACLDASGISIDAVSKIIIHQANEKMDEAIIKRFYAFYDQEPPVDCMPMSIGKLGNSSVATYPLYWICSERKKWPHTVWKKGLLLSLPVLVRE